MDDLLFVLSVKADKVRNYASRVTSETGVVVNVGH